jgi:hypothetical protein
VISAAGGPNDGPADYERRLAAEILAMLPDREEAKRVLANGLTAAL